MPALAKRPASALPLVSVMPRPCGDCNRSAFCSLSARQTNRGIASREREALRARHRHAHRPRRTPGHAQRSSQARRVSLREQTDAGRLLLSRSSVRLLREHRVGNHADGPVSLVRHGLDWRPGQGSEGMWRGRVSSTWTPVASTCVVARRLAGEFVLSPASLAWH